MKLSRACGVLLHPTCLPGPFGIGDLGPMAYRYLEWLKAAGATWWQVLPLNPPGAGESPYAALSTFAGNELLISPELLVDDGLLEPSDWADEPLFRNFTVDFELVAPFKRALLERAYTRFCSKNPAVLVKDFTSFRERNAAWLPDYALFAAARLAHRGAPWYEWPRALAAHEPGALSAWRDAHERDVSYHEFCQYLFARQWRRLRARAAELGIAILGDVPIFIAADSSDVWAQRELFRLRADGRPAVMAGVPPDYFSPTGQLWGNPLYDWDYLAATGFSWWTDRLRAALGLVDAVRLDHFRGFAACWEIPAGETTAVNGRWRPAPGRALFEAARGALGNLPCVAEDLGVITEDVVALREALELPGMAVLQFAFHPSERNQFIPYHHVRHQVVYTGTHDNTTAVGWFLSELGEHERDFACRYLNTNGNEINWDLIRAALASVADLAIVPQQDIAGLGADCRMNTPGVATGNWRFRVTEWMLDERLRDRFAELAGLYGRTPSS